MNEETPASPEHPARRYFQTVAALDAIRVLLVFIQWAGLTSHLEEAPILQLAVRLNVYDMILFSALAWGTYRLKNWARIAQFVVYPFRVIAVIALLQGGAPSLAKLALVPALVLVPRWFPLNRCGGLFGKPEAERPGGIPTPPAKGGTDSGS